jgi:DNA polymerase-3 subunit delta'
MEAGFVGVLGHAQVQAQLQRAVLRDQLHHALVFVGPRGVGKAALARGLACALHCTDRRGVGCGECSACRRVLAGLHVGVEWVAPETAGAVVKVAVARDLANRLEHAPFEGDSHVVVFDPAEALGEQAWSALLKTIEEPQPGVHFVLLTTGLDALLPTILSRSLVVRLGRLDDATVEQIVRERVRRSETDDEIGEDRIALAVRLADGSAGVAVSLALDPSLDVSLQLLRELVTAAQGGPRVTFGGERSSLWSAWAEATGGPATGRPARERAAAGGAAHLWLLHLRERIRGREGLPGLPPDDGDPRSILRRLDKVQALLEGLERNPNVRLALEQTLLDL